MDDLNRIQVIVPAAGQSRRFKEKGIDKPKPLIKFSYNSGTRQTMLEHSIRGVANRPIHIGCRQEDYEDFKGEFGNFENFHIYGLDTTQGQAHTVQNILYHGNFKLDKPVLVVNCDQMFLYPLDMFARQCEDFEAGVLVFDGQENKAYSYVDNFPIFQRAEEKQPISPWAIAGAFYFRSVALLVRALKDQEDTYIGGWSVKSGEPYLSHTFQFVDGDKLAVHMPKDKLVGWGTPEQLLSDPLVTQIKF
jgi:hypothetical protein